MNGNSDSGLAQIQTQIMWNRLISVVEEQAQTLLRTAFSTTVREAGDLSAGIFDTKGRMLAQAVTGTPGHVNSMAVAVQHFLARYPNEAMREGDVYITNDPWLTCGHLHDLTVVTPVFREGRIVGSFACTAHVVDIGGRGFGPDARSVFEEGLYIPIMPLCREGRINEDLLELVRWNVREPLQLEGDVHSLIACNRVGADRLLAMMEEFGLTDLDALGEAIVERSRAATLAAIAELPKGTYRNRLTMDGYDEPITLAAAMTVSGDGNPRRFHRHLARQQSRHQRGAQLHHRLHELRPQVHRGQGHSEQRGLARPAYRLGAGGLDPQRAEAVAGRRPPRHRPHAARPGVRLPAPGDPRAGAGGGRGLALDRAAARRRDRHRQRGQAQRGVRAAGVRGGALQLWRRRRPADQGRPLRDGLPKRRAHHSGGGHRDRGADRDLAEGARARYRRCRPAARRVWAR